MHLDTPLDGELFMKREGVDPDKTPDDEPEWLDNDKEDIDEDELEDEEESDDESDTDE
jgi:hypothetical protein